MEDPTKHLFDISAVLVAFGSLLEYLPTISAALSIIWLSLQIYFALEKRYLDRKSKQNGAQNGTT